LRIRWMYPVADLRKKAQAAYDVKGPIILNYCENTNS